MSAVFGSYDGHLENTSSMSDVADVFRKHCLIIRIPRYRFSTFKKVVNVSGVHKHENKYINPDIACLMRTNIDKSLT